MIYSILLFSVRAVEEVSCVRAEMLGQVAVLTKTRQTRIQLRVPCANVAISAEPSHQRIQSQYFDQRNRHVLNGGHRRHRGKQPNLKNEIFPLSNHDDRCSNCSPIRTTIVDTSDAAASDHTSMRYRLEMDKGRSKR